MKYTLKQIARAREIFQNGLEKVVGDTITETAFDGEVKVALYDITNGIYAGINADKPGWAASIIKIPIALAVLEQIGSGNLNLYELIKFQKRFILEESDRLSSLEEGATAPVNHLLYEMIAHSDNTATNMLTDRIGVDAVNKMMQKRGMKNTMLGHLLCPKAPRYTSSLNPDGSNITCPEDMVALLKDIYKYPSQGGHKEEYMVGLLKQAKSQYLSVGNIPSKQLNMKIGFISDPKDGFDVHEAGIIGNRIVACIMMNKIGQRFLKEEENEKRLDPQLVKEYDEKGFVKKAVVGIDLRTAHPLIKTARMYQNIANFISDEFSIF